MKEIHRVLLFLFWIVLKIYDFLYFLFHLPLIVFVVIRNMCLRFWWFLKFKKLKMQANKIRKKSKKMLQEIEKLKKEK
jgi:hypothetical protein